MALVCCYRAASWARRSRGWSAFPANREGWSWANRSGDDRPNSTRNGSHCGSTEKVSSPVQGCRYSPYTAARASRARPNRRRTTSRPVHGAARGDAIAWQPSGNAASTPRASSAGRARVIVLQADASVSRPSSSSPFLAADCSFWHHRSPVSPAVIPRIATPTSQRDTSAAWEVSHINLGWSRTILPNSADSDARRDGLLSRRDLTCCLRRSARPS